MEASFERVKKRLSAGTIMDRPYELHHKLKFFDSLRAEILRFQDFLVKLSGIKLLLFVCLKDSQEPKTKKKTNLSVGLGGNKRDRTADLLNAMAQMPWKIGEYTENMEAMEDFQASFFQNAPDFSRAFLSR